MGLFGNPRNNKDKWAAIVVPNSQPEMNADEKYLDTATTLYIQQHSRVLYDSIRHVLTSKNKKIKKERYKLTHYLRCYVHRLSLSGL